MAKLKSFSRRHGSSRWVDRKLSNNLNWWQHWRCRASSCVPLFHLALLSSLTLAYHKVLLWDVVKECTLQMVMKHAARWSLKETGRLLYIHRQRLNFGETRTQQSWHEARGIRETATESRKDDRTQVISLPKTMVTYGLKENQRPRPGHGAKSRKYPHECLKYQSDNETIRRTQKLRRNRRKTRTMWRQSPSPGVITTLWRR